jgi:hypothetical protein
VLEPVQLASLDPELFAFGGEPTRHVECALRAPERI